MSNQTSPVITASAPLTAPHRSPWALAVILGAQLMLILDVTVMNVALPDLQADLHFSAAGLSWVMTSYALTFGGLLLLGGRAGDVYGRRRLFIGGIALFTLASLAGGFAPSAGWLIAARLLQGVGAAAAGPSTIALITTTFTDARERIRALAMLSAISSAGFAIGLTVGGLLTQWASWRWVLLINVPVGLAIVAVAPRHIRESARRAGRLDVPGAVLATAGVAAVVAGLTRVADHGWSDPPTAALLGAGVVVLAAFVVLEGRTTEPLLPLRLFADRNRAAGYVSFFFGPAAMMSVFFFLTQFLQDVSGFGALATGLAFLPMAVAVFAFSRIMPRLLPRYGARPFAVTGAVLIIVGLLWLTQLTPTTPYFPGLFGPLLLLGLAVGIGFIPLTPTIMAAVPPQDAGAAGGLLQTMQQTGTALGLAVVVTVYGSGARDAVSAGLSPAEVTVAGMTHALWAALVFGVASLAVATTLRQVDRSGGVR
jgi:EmrB/QacA subfamily drug resistance transporter